MASSTQLSKNYVSRLTARFPKLGDLLATIKQPKPFIATKTLSENCALRAVPDFIKPALDCQEGSFERTGLDLSTCRPSCLALPNQRVGRPMPAGWVPADLIDDELPALGVSSLF